jgi:hypothetical protein
MPRQRVVQDMAATLAKRLFPSVTVWNRLEGRPRVDSFDRALRAEIRDPLWMLTRQWQLGEFEGDDAGSPVLAKVQMSAAPVDQYQAGSHAPRALDNAIPLEAQVEQRPLAFTVAAQPMSVDVRVLMGRQWLKMLAKGIAVDLSGAYRAQYPIAVPDPNDEAHALVVAHPEGFQKIALMAGRAMDGYRFYRHLKEGRDATAGVGAVGSDVTTIQALAAKFVAWFESLYLQPGREDDAWQPPFLEYQFSLAASDADMRYRADEYHQGRLDWYCVDRDASDEPIAVRRPPAPPSVYTFFPTEIVFEGMPNTRWWAFEDRKTNFGAITPNTTELGKLLFVEFGLIYANDWFLFPCPLSVGTVAQIAGLMVTNVFGERFWIRAAGSGADENWQRWSMFTNARRGSNEIPADTSLLMVPGLPKVQEGPPIDDVTLIRDEIANMVWAIETRVPMPSGESKPGRESALQTIQFFRRILGQQFATNALEPLDPASAAPIRYEVMSAVAENWIPFVPVHVEDDVRRIQLQRAALPRLMERDPRAPRKVEPRTPLMREGLDRAEKAPYFVHNEQVTRAGTRVYQSYQRTRWYGGRVITWLGARKQTGRGMGSSGLRFDRIRDVPPAVT